MIICQTASSGTDASWEMQLNSSSSLWCLTVAKKQTHKQKEPKHKEEMKVTFIYTCGGANVFIIIIINRVTWLWVRFPGKPD